LTFADDYVRRLTSVGPDTQTRYLRQVAALVGWLTEVKGVEPTIENVTSDDDRDWINARRRAGSSPKTIANYRGLLSAIFKSAVAKKEGFTKMPRFHDLRHTHAAWLISAGVPLPVVQKRLGHKSIQITVDVYGGLLFQTHEIADLAIDRALGGKKVLVATRKGRPESATAEDTDQRLPKGA
jgi:integrase